MPTLAPVREAPTNSLLSWNPSDPARQIQFDEPVLNIDDIQGGVLAPFSKDHRYLYSFRVVLGADKRTAAFKAWLRAQSDNVATTRQVNDFNRKWKVARSNGEETPNASWMSISLAYPLIKLLTEDCQFADEAFTQGLARRSPGMADPTEGEFAPDKWKVGGPGREADLFVILEADLVEDLNALEQRLLDSIGQMNGPFGDAIIQTLFRDEGHNLPGDLSGHEHFKFLDGVSQPGVRGLLSEDRTDVFTLRQHPLKRDLPEDRAKPASQTNQIQTAQGKPGQDILYPGEFVFGYPRQIPEGDDRADGPNPFPGEDSLAIDPIHRTTPAGPKWAKDGSYLVYRRLRQKVGAFHEFLQSTATTHGVPAAGKHSPAEVVGSRLVGRWASGAPVLRAFANDDPDLGKDDCANNNFEFGGTSDHFTQPKGDPSACEDNVFPQSVGDKEGAKCPFTAHIRKAYPRDDETDRMSPPNESDTQTHRLMRRGLPYGEVSDSTFEKPNPASDTEDRGLQFLCYQTSIENQFEFVIKQWVNDPTFKELFVVQPGKVPADQGGGYDPILGQSFHPERERDFTLLVDRGSGPEVVRLSTTADWVVPTGGGYFFTPSVSAIREVLSA